MMNNAPAQLSQKSFPRQGQPSEQSTTARGVWQDNPIPHRARTASPQPAPQKNRMRPQSMSTPHARSQNRPTPKRKTVHLTLWVKPVVKAELERIAEREGLSVSATGAAFLEEAIRQKLHIQHAVLLQPIIEQAIRKQMRGISTRLAWLLVRVAFDAGQTRSLVTNILSRQPGVTTDMLKHILDGSSKTAKGNIARRTPQMIELIEAVEQWMVAEEGEKQTNE